MRNSGYPEYSSMNATHTQLAIRYFNYLAHRFPVMCASDEFHFLPRAEDAAGYYDRLDDLAAGCIDECLKQLREFRQQFSRLSVRETNLENRIDLEVLKASATGIIIELGKNCVWRHNPLLYLKIAFIGIDHALNKPADRPQERLERIIGRMSSIPRLLGQAVENINQVPETYHHAAKAMLIDGKQYLFQTAEALSGYRNNCLLTCFQDTFAALDRFEKYLGSIHSVSDKAFSSNLLQSTLKDYFLSTRNLDEVFHQLLLVKLSF